MRHIAFDSHVLSYFLQANQPEYDPTADQEKDLARQRLPAYRLVLWTEVYVLPVVEHESQPIRDEVKRREHLRWAYYHLREVPSEWFDQGRIDHRVAELRLAHDKPSDCRLVAEADEVPEIEMVATNDLHMIRKLRQHTKLSLQSPADLWTALRILRGTSPRWCPADGHPHRHATWWRWG